MTFIVHVFENDSVMRKWKMIIRVHCIVLCVQHPLLSLMYSDVIYLIFSFEILNSLCRYVITQWEWNKYIIFQLSLQYYHSLIHCLCFFNFHRALSALKSTIVCQINRTIFLLFLTFSISPIIIILLYRNAAIKKFSLAIC